MDGMLKIDMQDTAVRRMREYFVLAKGKYPEDMIEVEEAIQVFVEFEKNLLRYSEDLANEMLRRVNYETPTILVDKQGL